MEFTGERYIPGAVGPHLAPRIHLEHVHRYALAAELVRGRVLDLGSGAGYGASMLASRADLVVGLDLFPAAARYGGRRFALPGRVGFAVGDGGALPFASESFDWVVCFETIEHVAAGESVLAEAARVLARDGTLIVSSPIGSEYQKTFPSHTNPFHVREYEVEELNSSLTHHFRHVVLLGQRLVFASWVWPLPGRFAGPMRAIETATNDWLAPTGAPLYTLALATNAEAGARAPDPTLLGGRLETALDGLVGAICERYEAEMAKRATAEAARASAERPELDRLREELTRLQASKTGRWRAAWRRARGWLGA